MTIEIEHIGPITVLTDPILFVFIVNDTETALRIFFELHHAFAPEQ